MKSVPRVKVKQGTLVGGEDSLPNGKPYHYFRGIPYAEPPVGELRFQAPVPVNQFVTPEIDCTKEGNVSIQKDPLTGEVIGSEDCLYLNVYVPENKTDTLLPVMVFLHGGMYMYGSGNSFMYTPLYLIQEGVLVVTINFRLGLLGLLALPEINIPGNLTLKDQHLALQWIKENIAQFNGDPNNVTLFGESSGACCAHLLLLSPNFKKLFHKAILQSGTANMEWAISRNPTASVMNVANLLGCKSKDPGEVYTFLKNYPNVSDFLVRRSITRPVLPVVEDVSAKAIVTENPLKAMHKPNSIDIPIMMGYNSGEGILFISRATKNLKIVEKDIIQLTAFKFNLNPNDPKCLELAEKIRHFYFKDGVVDELQLNALVDVYGDFHFVPDCNEAAETHSRNQPKSPLYVYRFDYSGGLNKYKDFFGLNHLNGVCHADELFYIFQSDLAREPWDEKDKVMVKRMCKLWTNFAKHGNPTPDKNDRFVDCTWEPVPKVSGDGVFKLNAFIIDEEQRMLDNPDKERIDFWRDIRKSCQSNLSKL